MTTVIDFKWKMVEVDIYGGLEAIQEYHASVVPSPQDVIMLSVAESPNGTGWYYRTYFERRLGSLESPVFRYVGTKADAPTLEVAKAEAEATVPQLINAMKALHEVDK